MNSKSPFGKFITAGKITLLFIIASTFIYYFIGGGEWTPFECFYMTIISITTVGYGEILDFTNYPEGRVFSIFVVVWGYILLVYFVSVLSELLVTGEVKKFFRKRQVKKMLGKSKNHFIICGFGEMGYHVARELDATYHTFVVVDTREQIYDLVTEKISPKIPVVQGDASDENVLKEAGIEKARGLVLTLPEDKDNLFTMVAARSINPALIVATKCVHESNVSKFFKAGASKVIAPAQIGGMRLASELIRPTVTTFLDIMLRDKEKNLRIDEIELNKDMECIEKTLQESMFRNKTKVLIMAVAFGNGEFVYNPPADLKLEEGYKLIVLGESKDIAKFKKLI